MKKHLSALCVSSVILISAAYICVYGNSFLNKEPEFKHDWVIIYYMSYDNNLEGCGPVIINELQDGIKDSGNVITVLSDDSDRNGLKRFVITSAGTSKEILQTDNSASEDTLEDYLDWVTNNYTAKNYALIFLDHGGCVDEMCYDERPGKGIKKRWLSAQKVGAVLEDFTAKVKGRFRLLFLQQCGRGSVENLYNFRNTAETIMASQMNVGAPNTYYKNTIKWLSTHENTGGADLAAYIMTNDRDFGNYVSIRSSALAELPAQLNLVIGFVLDKKKNILNTELEISPCYGHGDEHFYDLFIWLEKLYRANGVSEEPLEKFKKWVRDELIITVGVNPESGKTIRELCGLSLLVPEAREQADRYRNYPLYVDGKLCQMWSEFVPSPE